MGVEIGLAARTGGTPGAVDAAVDGDPRLRQQRVGEAAIRGLLADDLAGQRHY